MWVKSDLKDLIKQICGRISCYFQRLQGYGKGLGQHCNTRPKKPQSNGVMQIIVLQTFFPLSASVGLNSGSETELQTRPNTKPIN